MPSPPYPPVDFEPLLHRPPSSGPLAQITLPTMHLAHISNASPSSRDIPPAPLATPTPLPSISPSFVAPGTVSLHPEGVAGMQDLGNNGLESNAHGREDTHHQRTSRRRKPHESISHAQKRRLCELSGENPKAKHGYIAKLFMDETGRQVDRSTVTRALQRRDFWMNAGCREGNRKRLTSSRFPMIEEAMWEMIRNRSIVPILREKLVDKELITLSKEFAVELGKIGGKEKGHVNYVQNLDQFKGSISWVTSFKRRNAIKGSDDEYGGRGGCPKRTMDMWTTEFNPNDTKELLTNWTRFEDLYFLEATVLATAVLPEEVVAENVSSSSNASLEEDTAINDAWGLLFMMHTQDLNGGVGEMGGPSFPNNNFSLPPIQQCSAAGPSHIADSVPPFNISRPDPFLRGLPNANRAIRKVAKNTGNSRIADDDGVVVTVLCANGVGHRLAPWIVGKQAFRNIGEKEGEVWHDSKVRYFHNMRGWLTSRIVRTWVEEFDKSLNRSVVLLTSLLTGPDLEQLNLKNVTIVPLPRTNRLHDYNNAMLWRSKSSPLHLGIEEHFRTKYRCLVMDRAVGYVSRADKVKKLSMKSAAKMIEEAWNNVPAPLMRKAWREPTYIPGRLIRSTTQSRVSTRLLIQQRLDDLVKLVHRYRQALSSSEEGRKVQLQTTLNDPRQYIWWASEGSVFHPKGTPKDFLHSVCRTHLAKNCSSEESDSANEDQNPIVRNVEEALQAANRLAEFMNSFDSENKRHCMYLIGSLQSEFKQLCDRAHDEKQNRMWSAAPNVHNHE